MTLAVPCYKVMPSYCFLSSASSAPRTAGKESVKTEVRRPLAVLPQFMKCCSICWKSTRYSIK